MKKYKFFIENLDCANCAQKIEDYLNRQSSFQNVVVNFAKLTMSLETNLLNPLPQIQTYVNEVEEGVRITSERKSPEKKNGSLILFLLGALSFLVSLIMSDPYQTLFLILTYAIFMIKIVPSAYLSLKKATLNENFLILISSVGAYLVGEKVEGMMVLLLYSLGKLLEEKAVHKSRQSIEQLMDIEPRIANLYVDGKIKEIAPEQVQIGDVLVIKNGEKIPVDGLIKEGQTLLNTSSLTGESKPIRVKEQDQVLSGSINIGSEILLIATTLYQDSTVAKILNLMETATDKKAQKERLVSKWAKIYTPTVLIIAILVGIFLPLFSTVSVEESIYRALTFLVISCPCAIAISVPLSYFSGIGMGSKKGILFKGSDYLDQARKITTIFLDKTGTITTGKFSVQKIVSLTEEYQEEDIFKYIYYAECHSNHPLAKSILDYQHLPEAKIKNVQEIPGKGITYTLNNQTYAVGKFFKEEASDQDGTTINLYCNEKKIGYLFLKDQVKESSQEAIQAFQKLGVHPIMITGDNSQIAQQIAQEVGIEEVYSDLLPKEKYTILEKKILAKNPEEQIAFVGDGINDAPTLARSDIGISMGINGSQSAIEASDIVIMNDDLKTIADAIKISQKTNTIILENVIFAFAIKLCILIVSILGISTMWQAVFADVGVTILTIFNSLRILVYKTK